MPKPNQTLTSVLPQHKIEAPLPEKNLALYVFVVLQKHKMTTFILAIGLGPLFCTQRFFHGQLLCALF